MPMYVAVKAEEGAAVNTVLLLLVAMTVLSAVIAGVIVEERSRWQ